MSWTDEVLEEIHSALTPSEFERLIYLLLDKMEFKELELVGRSGDGGIDLKGTWTQSQVPGLEIDLNFIIQVKRYSSTTTLNPRFIRELRGSMQSGEWGLLITTSRVSSNSREDGLRDPSRIISVIDGVQLTELCAKYEVGVRKEFSFDPSLLKPKAEPEEKPEAPPPTTYPRDLSSILTTALSEEFEKIGRKPIYKSSSKIVIARWSQKYDKEGQDYWYALTARDVEDIENYDIKHFAYVCADNGVVLLPVTNVKKRIRDDELLPTPSEGPLKHYHIFFVEENGKMMWILKTGVRKNVQEFYHAL